MTREEIEVSIHSLLSTLDDLKVDARVYPLALRGSLLQLIEAREQISDIIAQITRQRISA